MVNLPMTSYIHLFHLLGCPSNVFSFQNKVKNIVKKDFFLNKYYITFSGTRNLKFQYNWFNRFPWLTYTKIGEQGALCKYCVLFAGDEAGKGDNQKLSALVKKPFNKYKNAIEIFTLHSQNNYHKKAVLLADNFVKIYTRRQPNILEQIDQSSRNKIMENREKLISIIEIIKFCGRQELGFRGTNDSGPISVSDPEPDINDGNFRALLRMRAKTDTLLKSHLEKSGLNAKYISPTVQNEFIRICGSIIKKNIVQSITESGMFSILADETTDVSRIEQMTLCIRYIDLNKNGEHVVKEDFLGFVPVKILTGKGLSVLILETLRDLGINCSMMVGQGYDGAAAMSGSFKGVQAEIRKKYPCALYVHCSSHCLNLALSHSCKVQSIRNCIGTIKSIGSFLKLSAKRTALLQEKIKQKCPEANWSRLVLMCETRWVEKHTALMRFKEIYTAIIECLEDLSECNDIETSSKASAFLKNIICSEFVISLCVAESLFSYTVTLSKILQTVNCDLPSALSFVDNVKLVIGKHRTDIDKFFHKIFKDAEKMLEAANEFISMPRINKRQINRVNVTSTSPEEYYKIAIAIPFIDDFLNQIDERFFQHKATFKSLAKLLPKNIKFNKELVNDDLHYTLNFYNQFINREAAIAETEIWQTKWENENGIIPDTATTALDSCDKLFFPNVYTLIKILSTLPVTTATPERTFSALKRVKSYIRNSTGQERMSDLALMSIYRNINIDNEEVLNIFAEKARRLDLHC